MCFNYFWCLSTYLYLLGQSETHCVFVCKIGYKQVLKYQLDLFHLM